MQEELYVRARKSKINCKTPSKMGRYVFFNTGKEYKFCFAVQPSQDIHCFGGFDNNSIDNPIHVWSQEDNEYILGILKDMEEGYQISPTDFSKFENTLEGTKLLYNKIYEDMKIYKSNPCPEYYKYMLGALIYHQLLYTNILTAEYEY